MTSPVTTPGPRYLRVAILSIALGILAALIYGDVRPYYAALRAVNLDSNSEPIERARKAVVTDVEAFTACNTKRAADYTPTPEWRSCMLSAMRESRSVKGGMLFAMAAAQWLDRNPGDREVRAAAMEAIDKSWAELGRLQPYVNAFEAVAAVHDKSVLLRLRDGRISKAELVSADIDGLIRAEHGLLAPGVLIKRMRGIAGVQS